MENESSHIPEVGATINFKSFFLRVLSYWKLFALSLIICLGMTYYYNQRTPPVYRLENTISIKDDQNPFFTSNTSLTFNWGGTSDKVNTAITILRSRSHNEQVVRRLQYYVQYSEDGEYQRVNAYGELPFKVIADTAAFQALDIPFTIEFQDKESFTLSASFPERQVELMNYNTRERSFADLETRGFSRRYRINESIRSPFFNGRIISTGIAPVPGDRHFVEFRNFDAVVARFRNISVNPQSVGASILTLSLIGENKAELVDYLNASVEVLSENLLARKNLFATKTIRFIDSSLAIKSDELHRVEQELNHFREQNSILDFQGETERLLSELYSMDTKREEVRKQLDYYATLEDYLKHINGDSNVSAPSVAGIREESVIRAIASITALAEERRKYRFSFKEDSPVINDIDRRIAAVKAVVLENMASSQMLLGRELQDIDKNLALAETQLKKLPQEERNLVGIQRNYALNERDYNLFLQKRREAGLVKAANVSEVMIIDPARDTGDAQIGPNTHLNYAMAVLVGGLAPFTVIFLMVFLNTRIHNSEEIAGLSRIPVLGLIGKSRLPDRLLVFRNPKSAIAESFRGLRSSLQFVFRREEGLGSKSILVTSSVSGEGKTFCAINLATVFALSEKKTLLIGGDLRKPKIFEEFEITNRRGLVNYLLGEQRWDEVIQPSAIPHLDIITSGPVPANPSELLMNGKMEVLMQESRESYDYIIIDTPPIGVVADALNLVKHTDVLLYVVRQNYTKRSMLKMINAKYEKGQVKNISFVLNHFVQRAKYGYGYGHGYGHIYSYGKYGSGYHQNRMSGRTGNWWKNFKNYLR